MSSPLAEGYNPASADSISTAPQHPVSAVRVIKASLHTWTGVH